MTPDVKDIDLIYSYYLELGSVHKVGERFGVTGDTIHQKLKKAGFRLNNPRWSPMEISAVVDAYNSPDGVNIADVSRLIFRTHAAVACKAEELGLTSRRGKYKWTKEHLKNVHRTTWTAETHPRGMKGKKHSDETRAVISKKGMGRKKTPETVMKALKTRVANNGNAAPLHGRGSWKSSWQEFGGKRFFARSRWESNYARYLELLKGQGALVDWEHEPETFWFEKILRGTRSYLPDFRITYADGSIEYHEVKGWMDSRSKTKIRRMAKYHPKVKLVVRDAKWFRDNEVELSITVPGWERKTRK